MSDLFFQINNDSNATLKYKKSNIDFNTKIMKKFNDYVEKRKLIDNSFVQSIIKLRKLNIDNTKYIFRIFKIDLKNSIFIRALPINNKLEYYVEHIKDDKIEKLCDIKDNLPKCTKNIQVLCKICYHQKCMLKVKIKDFVIDKIHYLNIC